MMVVVAAALIDAAGRCLLQKRAAGKSMAGLWEFPGGKVEIGETPEAALVRELSEELGILVDVADLDASCFASEPMEGRHLLLLLYICRVWVGDPLPLDAAELRWVSVEHITSLDMPPADKPLALMLERLMRA
jgi:8-oxo-dGTP diphosphatase